MALLRAVDELAPFVMGKDQRRLRRILRVADADALGGDGHCNAVEHATGTARLRSSEIRVLEMRSHGTISWYLATWPDFYISTKTLIFYIDQNRV